MQQTDLKQLKEALRNVKVPGAKLSILEAGQVLHLERRENSVLVELQMGDLNPTLKKSLEYQIDKALKAVDPHLNVSTSFQEQIQKPKNRIGSMIAVGSGKGGVGKSSVTVNLAIALQKIGYSVGILDCDIYGPSIPMMLGARNEKPMVMGGRIQPIERFGIKLMSAGFFVEEGQSLVWRGPMIHKLIQQFSDDVNWDGIDILLIDLPPGTGDAPLSLAQTMSLTGAVLVSTPQAVALLDVHKAAAMFNQVKVPILGVVENMSHFVCPHCGGDSEIFSRGGVRAFCGELGLTYLGDIPMEPKIRAGADSGEPFLATTETGPAAKAFQSVAKLIQPFLKTADDAARHEHEDAIQIVL